MGVTRGSITKYIKNGRIVATLIGGKKYLTEENIKSFLLDTEAKIK